MTTSSQSSDQSPPGAPNSQPPHAPHPGHGAKAEECGELQEGSVNEPDNEKKEGGPPHVGGAAVAGGIIGTALAGPIIGIAAAGGATIAATMKGTAGDVTRGVGGALEGAHQGAKELNEKHQIVDKAAEVGSTVVDHTRKGFDMVSQSAKEFDERHNVVEKTKQGADTIAKGITGAEREEPS